MKQELVIADCSDQRPVEFRVKIETTCCDCIQALQTSTMIDGISLQATASHSESIHDNSPLAFCFELSTRIGTPVLSRFEVCTTEPRKLTSNQNYQNENDTQCSQMDLRTDGQDPCACGAVWSFGALQLVTCRFCPSQIASLHGLLLTCLSKKLVLAPRCWQCGACNTSRHYRVFH